MSSRQFFATLIWVGLSAGVAANAHSETTLRFNQWLPSAHPMHAGILAPWAESVGKATNGSVKLEFTGNSLAPVPRQFDAIKNGIVDVSLGSHPFTPARFSLHRVIELPFNNLSAEALSVAFWRVSQKFFTEANEYSGIKVLGHYVMGGGQFHTTKPITSIESFKGMKIALAGGMQTLVANKLGVTPIGVPAGKYFELLSRGTADGIALTRWAVFGFNLQEFVKNHLEVPGGLYTSSFFIAMNQQKWDGLSKRDQDAVASVSGEAMASFAGGRSDKFDNDAVAKYKAQGATVIEPDPQFTAALRQRLMPLHDDWIAEARKKNVDGASVLKFIGDTVKSYN